MNSTTTQHPSSPKFIGRLLPVTIIIAYIIFGFLLFNLAPFNWIINNRFFLILYVSMIVIFTYIGFSIKVGQKTRLAPNVNYKLIILIGAIFSLIVLIPATLLYSGKYPWQFMELIADQAEAYGTYQSRLADSTSADRAPVALLRTIVHPLVFAALPLAVLHWRSIAIYHKIAAFTLVLCLVIISLARGTDRETADLAIGLITTTMIVYYRGINTKSNDTSSTKQKLKKKPNKAAIIAVLSILMMVVFWFFVERKLGRYGGNYVALCVGSDQDICMNYDSGIATILGQWGAFALGITASYMSAGYYGLNLAMDLPFQSTLGTGFSPMIARYYEVLSGDTSLYLNSYTYRMRAMGWSDEYTWSTLMVWFANDVGFFGALLILFGLACVFGASWRDAVRAHDDRAAIVFVLMFTTFIYLPANNQIGQTLDLSFAFLFWLFQWQYHKRRV
jgi:hypothetical protein